MSIANRIKENNKQLIRDIFAGTAKRHAFMYQSPLIPLAEVGDFTLSSEPVQKWVPWVLENYRRKVKSLERHQDDSVPVSKLSTGTRFIFTQLGGDDETATKWLAKGRALL